MSHTWCTMSRRKGARVHPDRPMTLDPAQDSEAGISELIREDILEGRLRANERLVASALAKRYGTSTNPVREALQQLRGEGFVVISPNRGARVRPIDASFVRDLYEIEMLIQPNLTRWFVTIATPADIAELERIQDEIERLNFSDPVRHSELDFRFHMLMYERHYNRHMVELWSRYRAVLHAMSRRHATGLLRRAAVIREHRALIEAIKAQDVEAAVKAILTHVEDAGRHIVQQMLAARHERDPQTV
jgi:DNA-binding GntR family transcriptional regulator